MATIAEWRLVRALLDLIYPRHCTVCGDAVGNAGRYVCWDCRAGIDIVAAPFCECCGDPAEGRVEQRFTCSFCARQKPHFELARSAARYRKPLDTVLQSFKYRFATCLNADLLPLLAACVNTHYGHVRFDGVTDVPLHPLKERIRTYNQSRLLARGLAGIAEAGRFISCLRRVRPTPTQTGLSARARRINVKDAFEPTKREWIEGRTLLLVDDVMTTGATVNECARTLKMAGAAGVYVVTVARG